MGECRSARRGHTRGCTQPLRDLRDDYANGRFYQEEPCVI